MKRLAPLLLVLVAIIAGALTAEAQKKSNNTYIVKTIPAKMNIEDKIIVENSSSFVLTTVNVYLVDSNGKYQRLGTASNLARDKKAEVKSYEDNGLEKLRGRKIAVSIVGEGRRPSSLFDIKLDDHRHDLYLEVVDKGK